MSISGATSSISTIECIKRTLFKNAMDGDWAEVINLYKNYPETHCTKITESGNTALNMAVLDGEVIVVEKLVASMKMEGDPHASEALGMNDDAGNTPLHYAAVMGNVRMCKCIAEVDSRLIGLRNHDGETPFFLAVLHGEKSAFLCLHSICGRERGYTYCRRSDGDTILHCAITGEYFGIFVDELVPQTSTGQTAMFEGVEYKKSAKKYPENCQTCVNFTWLLNKVFYLIGLGSGKGKSKQTLDVEDPNSQRLRKITERSLETQENGHHLFPANYITCFEAIKFLFKAMLIIIGLGSREIMKIEEKKQKHVWSKQVLDELLKRKSSYKDDGQHPQETPVFDQDGTPPYSFKHGGDVTFSASVLDDDETITQDNGGRKRMWDLSKETPILIAAKNGVVEMVANIIQRFPVAIHDINSDKKNIALLAVENRQPQVYQLLLSKKTIKASIFRKVDSDGNSVLHLAAKLGHYRPWLNQDAALHMQREIKWFQYVRNSMPVESIARLNRAGKTPEEIFVETHSELVKVAAEWLTKTSESCSFVAALIATVAFATSATIPGGVKQDIGTPALEQEPAFYVFATSSLVALCFSVTSTVIFLSILTSGFQIKDFRTSLPRKLLTGLTALCVSIIAMMCSFCASHFFILKDKIGYGAFGIYAAMALMPVIMTVFLMSKFPHSGDLMWATFTYLPQAIPLPERSDELLLESSLY